MASVIDFPPAGPPDDELEAIPYAEDTLALQFADLHHPWMRYVAIWGHWMTWNGVTWRKDSTLAVFDKVRELCRREAALKKAEAKRAGANANNGGRRLLDGKTIAAVEKLARTDRRLAADAAQWDADPWRLNTPSGSIGLQDASQREPEPGDYATKVTAVAPADSGCPLWLAFLEQVTNGDEELAAYIQRLAGYCLTGLTIEHAMFFIYGTGANGKSVLVNTLAGVMGDYAMTASIDLFLATKSEQHPTGIASLAGARLVSVVETEKGRRWAEAKLKGLTGGDKISARLMRQDFFEFQPRFKLIVAGNHKPGLRGVDEAIRRRMNLLPFTRTIAIEDRDPELFEKLKAEWPGILYWMIEGCLLWQRDRLSAPPAVVEATEHYLEQEDAFGQWLNEACDLKNGAYCLTADLFASWKAWAERNGEFIGSVRSFGQSLEDRGAKSRREGGTGRRGYSGIELRRTDLYDAPSSGGAIT